MKVSTILDHIDSGTMALPEFQRGYVWNRDQVRSLMDSLYRGHPIGTLLVWETQADAAKMRQPGTLPSGPVKLLLDGQQRITTLYGIMRGSAPAFFDGSDRAFIGLYFHLEEEVFEFYGPIRMKDDPLWVSVTEMFKPDAIEDLVVPFMQDPELSGRYDATAFLGRVNKIRSVQDKEMHVEEVSGNDKTVDIVVDIFNRVNSGGTKLSKGDLALAKICADWPDARRELKATLKRWADKGLNFKMEWLLRNVNAICTGEAIFSALENVPIHEFEEGLKAAEKHSNYVLNLLATSLGLDHDRVVASRYAFAVMCAYLHSRDGKMPNAAERKKLLYWYIHTILWGRYSGSTESTLKQDLELLKGEQPLERLIGQMRVARADLTLNPEDFRVWSVGSRFYPLLYMLTRVNKARDWGTGAEMSALMHGPQGRLEVHHIFPRAVLYRNEYPRHEVNTLANFCFLTRDTNLHISDTEPDVYFRDVENDEPGALASQWVPMDERLWKVENYRDFLDARRDLLTDAANTLLDSLYDGRYEPPAVESTPVRIPTADRASSGTTDDETEALLAWLSDNHVRWPDDHVEVVPEDGGEAVIADLAWPGGLQEGYSQPLALVTHPEEITTAVLNALGYRYFTDIDALRNHISVSCGLGAQE